MGKNIPSGGKPRQCFEHFEKCRFRHSETTDSFPKIGLKFPGNLWSAFLMMSYDVLQKKREFVLEKVRDVFPSHIAMRFIKERPVTSKRLLILEFIQRHCHTLMLRINFGFTWRLVLVERLHGMADFDSRHIAPTPPVRIRTCFFLIRFFIQNAPLEWLQASWRQPNLWLKDG